MANTTVHSVRIPDPRWAALERLGARDDRSVSYLINKAVAQLLQAEGIEEQAQD